MAWRFFFCFLGMAFFGSNLTHVGRAAESQPNILLLVSDDQRPDTIGALGNNVIQTPHLDTLARQGVVFTRAICANPICTPSRGEILKGCSGFRTGIRDFGGKFRDGFASLASVLQKGGYDTHYVGKWHNQGRPSTHGYQSTRGLFAGGGGKWWKDQVDAHGRPVTGYRGWIFQTDERQLFPERGVGLTPDISARFADAAIELINQDRKNPFFIHVNFTAPHDPLLVPPGFADAYAPEQLPLPDNFLPQHPFDTGNLRGRDEQLLPWPRTSQVVRADLAVYYAVITHLDQQVGRILRALDRRNLTDDTLVIYTSDHGLAMGSHGLRGKQNMYEHTINVPLLMRGPGVPRGVTFETQMYLRDLYPTICDFAHAPLLNPVDGRSVRPVLEGNQETLYPYVFGYFRDYQRMVRGPRWKLIYYPKIDRWQLFDLKQDPHELHNVAQQPAHATTLHRLQQQLVAWQRRVGDDLLAK